ncbi:putative 2-oxo-4-hydroxy-4-carboxy-5-ureidoimidazoline decarboxylase [Spea bombifrons]|uniref:putative 2-oxo-4-hydroxy-4-carboxy-5-ureidoimidazoline decarboxylase n=1 Tax=Spea bombifrons TaxID=233779 RepID=UPI00234B557A|nr:putative 2-oxo-4-hydroxy-4-carboxy-5-ureidoimidazoline decarboxylase [Spea bombifrons]
MDLNTVNAMSYGHFMDIFGNIIEKCPLITGAVWSKHPFSSFPELENCVYEFIDSLPPSGKEGILRCHPDLAGRELMSGTLTSESQHEQRQAGLTSLSQADRERLTLLNYQYKEKFGFPFVICAKMSDRNKIMEELSSRLQNEKDEELQTGIAEVKKICHLRLQDIFVKAVPTKL